MTATATRPAAEQSYAASAPQARTTRPPRGGSSGAFPTHAARRRWVLLVAGLTVLAAGLAFLLLAWKNPMPMGTKGFWLIAERRGVAVLVIAVVALCQAVATVAFQTVTTNRIITPSIMGFESLYVAVQTSVVYFLGAAGLVAFMGTPQFLLQLGLMVGLSVLLFGWLLSGRYANLQVMLLIGIIIGGGLRSVSTFMQRLLSPSEFDLLSARMFGSVDNAHTDYLGIAGILTAVGVLALCLRSRRLDVLALGRDIATGLGVNHRRETKIALFWVSLLMAVSTALVGPMTFLGFLVATLAYQLAGTHEHRFLLPVAVLLGMVVLLGAYFVMNHVFYGGGVVSIIIELVGGTLFLVVLLRKGRL